MIFWKIGLLDNVVAYIISAQGTVKKKKEFIYKQVLRLMKITEENEDELNKFLYALKKDIFFLS